MKPLFLLCLALFDPPGKTRIWLIGDSTMADKEVRAYPETGWGMPFAHFFDSTIVVDNRAKNGRSTKSFISNLERYIDETKKKSAIPILLTPVARRKFDSTGRIVETHTLYADAVREVAAKEKVAFIDLDEKSKTLLQEYGPEASKLLFNYLQPGQHPNYPEGHKDDTHFNELGAPENGGDRAGWDTRIKYWIDNPYPKRKHVAGLFMGKSSYRPNPCL